MSDELLVARGVEAGYPNKKILFGVDFEVRRGEVVALLGANGSGKSTALNCVSGFIKPSAGSIRVNGHEIAGRRPHEIFRAGVAQVSQSRDLFPDMTVGENLRLGAARRPHIGADRQLATKAGARLIKIMANGGVASPTDPIGFLGFSREELLAVVEEAEMAQTYVAGHLYTDEAIRRFVECGGHSIEHGSLVEPATARLMQEKGAVVVPTLVTLEVLAEEGASLGFPADSLAKLDDVRGGGLRSLEIYREAGVKIAYGTDLLGPMHRHQLREFEIRSRVLSPFDVLQSATTIAAELVHLKGRVGAVEPGAFADLLVVDGNPLEDMGVLAGHGERLLAIMKEGRFVKDGLGA